MSSILENRPAILYVDNEIQNLVSFRALFRRDYTIYSASSLPEAIAILETQRAEIIICSKHIGTLTGIDFLASTIGGYPNSSRLLVSDYAGQDMEDKAQIFRYLIKPWDEADLAKVLKESHELFVIKQAISQNFW